MFLLPWAMSICPELSRALPYPVHVCFFNNLWQEGLITVSPLMCFVAMIHGLLKDGVTCLSLTHQFIFRLKTPQLMCFAKHGSFTSTGNWRSKQNKIAFGHTNGNFSKQSASKYIISIDGNINQMFPHVQYQDVSNSSIWVILWTPYVYSTTFVLLYGYFSPLLVIYRVNILTHLYRIGVYILNRLCVIVFQPELIS